jgi:hypothetical protein
LFVDTKQPQTCGRIRHTSVLLLAVDVSYIHIYIYIDR